MYSEALDKTVITDNWQIFLEKLFQHFIHRKKILKFTKFQFNIICRSRAFDKNIPLWYILPPPGASRVKTLATNIVKALSELEILPQTLRRA